MFNHDFTDDKLLFSSVTDYAKATGANFGGTYWLRSPHYDDGDHKHSLSCNTNCSVSVGYSYGLSHLCYGCRNAYSDNYYDSIGVRPACTIYLK
jgi:hypothetical protein